MEERAPILELSSAEQAPEAEPRRSLPTGAFEDEALERSFVREQFALSDGRLARVGMIVGALCFLSYTAHDLYVTPEAAGRTFDLRFGLFLPPASACIALSFTRWFERFHQQIVTIFGCSATVTVLTIAAVLPRGSFYAFALYASFYVSIASFLLKMRVPAQATYVGLSLVIFNTINLLLPSDLPRVSFAVNFAISCLGVLGTYIAWHQGHEARTSFLQRRTIARQVAIIGAEREKAELLLLNILPAAIAERLKSKHEAIADGFPEVTVLFSDIVGFTRLSQRVSPSELVVRLNSLFSAFDDVAVELGLEKIKTIGDAYMVVGGLPSPHRDHAGGIAEMALRMQRIVRENAEAHGDDLDVRIGIHTGPAVAGVIGKRKFVYDVWGDTVNTASRMESHGEPGRIQVSEATQQRLEGRFGLEPRGTIEVKGKGPMRTFFLVAR